MMWECISLLAIYDVRTYLTCGNIQCGNISHLWQYMMWEHISLVAIYDVGTYLT